MELPGGALELLADLLEALESGGFPAMIVRGVATFAWGDPRTTRDLDLAAHAEHGDLDAVERILVDAGQEPEGPFSTHWGPRFIVPSDTGFPVDVFLDARGELFQRRRRVTVGDRDLWVKSPEDVIIEKLLGARDLPQERSRDLQDAVGILYKQAEDLETGYLERRAQEEGIAEELTQARTEIDAFGEEEDRD